MPVITRCTVEELLAESRAGLARVGPHEALTAQRDEGALLVDIRSEGQRERDGLIPGALVLERNVLEWRACTDSGYADPVLAADLARVVVLVCDEGYQSSLAAATLQRLGYPCATDLDGGFRAWRAAGLPVTPPRPRPR